MTLSDIVGDLPVVLLSVELPRDQVLVDEPAGALLDLDVVGPEGVGSHAQQDTGPSEPL
jgi:hypothetical protein